MYLGPTQGPLLHQMAVLGLMELDSAIFKGIIPVMVYRKCLRHPNQPSHINGGDNVRMLDGSGERDSGSSKAVLFVFYRCPPPAPTEETTSCLSWEHLNIFISSETLF